MGKLVYYFFFLRKPIYIMKGKILNSKMTYEK